MVVEVVVVGGGMVLFLLVEEAKEDMTACLSVFIRKSIIIH